MPVATLKEIAGILQVNPNGLLGLLQLKNRGQFPQRLDPNLQPTLELLDWYLQDNAAQVGESGLAIAAVGATVVPSLLVPAGEAWWVNDYVVSAQAAAGQTLEFAGGWSIPGGASYQLGPYELTTVGLNARTRIDRRRFFGPACQGTVHVRQLVAGPINVNANARITRCKL